MAKLCIVKNSILHVATVYMSSLPDSPSLCGVISSVLVRSRTETTSWSQFRYNRNYFTESLGRCQTEWGIWSYPMYFQRQQKLMNEAHIENTVCESSMCFGRRGLYSKNPKHTLHESLLVKVYIVGNTFALLYWSTCAFYAPR